MSNILILVFLTFRIYFSSTSKEGWGYINLNCRDNDNSPVDWWYIFKPPSDVVPFFELGRNFTFITPDSIGRWEPSEKYITSNSMLQHTLAPIFRPTYADYLAVAIYDSRLGDKNSPGSVARGVLMADEMGGVWIYHTVPGLVDMSKDRPSFPEKEGSNGHLLMCLSLNLETVNEIAHNLRNVYPRFSYMKISDRIQHLVPEWKFLDLPLKGIKPKAQRFQTRRNSLVIELILRRPGEIQSVYEKFASTKNIVLDVYGQTDSITLGSMCGEKYSVRNIDGLSLKFPDSVQYLRNEAGRMHFAVSTAAHWQTLGSGPKQYWSCISNLDRDYGLSGLGGDLVCVDNYKIWLTFDNLKVAEPKCS